MTSISSITSTQPLVVTPTVATQPVATSAVGTTPSTASPSSVVMLGQDTLVTNAQTYTARGVIADADVPPAWEYTRQDSVTLAMQGNFSTTHGVGRFQGLGATLLAQLAQTGKGVSQSVISSPSGRTLEPSELAAAQNKLHSSAADNSISLTLKTASGKTVQLTLSSSENGLAVQAQVSGGDLSDDELAALGKMADGFQSAIDGLTAKSPQLKLDALTQYDSNVFSSVTLSTRIKLNDGSVQSLDMNADADQRSVRMSGASGNLDISVDLKNAAIIGNSDQQAKAVKNYVSQIEAARTRGDGDAQLLSLFEDGFKTLHSQYPGARPSIAPQTVNSIDLTDTDHGLLTGLADFKASVTEKTEASNPARPDELDAFSYNLSQSTQSKGRDQLNRTLVQNQQSSLIASYHKALTAGQKLDLSRDPTSQNYLYYQINDQASSKTNIGYDKGALVQASVSQSASQSTRISKYVMGHLESDTRTPLSSSKTQNFLSVLQQALQQDKDAKQGRGVSTLKDTLAGIQDKVLLRASASDREG
ncbi:lactate dehydrogenase [Pseudomonas sp. SLFW]|uniref:lactate dehydrogenase n=1 Tax=Pseudomonas sp. SLFW TaxID=2683259 RepID=UPI0014136B21|nr:lactate dehydrogenase [Pseudomonas sp. SLFW]NBB09266.1 lactate dehydrogenase [Pseudomonas sp. SLFW]